MRKLSELDKYRVSLTTTDPWERGEPGNDMGGAFEVPVALGKVMLRIIASNGEGWDHASVSVQGRCPTWEEMELVKRMFFKDDETAMQLHVPPDKHISYHPYCLHLWRPHNKLIPLPPHFMV